jgi:hypothetical protein
LPGTLLGTFAGRLFAFGGTLPGTVPAVFAGRVFAPATLPFVRFTTSLCGGIVVTVRVAGAIFTFMRAEACTFSGCSW